MSYLPIVWRPQIDNIYTWDALGFLRRMETGGVNCIITSPPYFGLRDYGAEGQIGLAARWLLCQPVIWRVGKVELIEQQQLELWEAT